MNESKHGLAYELYEVSAAISSIADHLEDSDDYVGDGILLKMLSDRLADIGGKADEIETDLAKRASEGNNPISSQGRGATGESMSAPKQ
jgi:hypothetical protein